MRCNNCCQTFDDGLDMCPFCGYEDGDPPKEPYFLYPGMMLNNRYIVGEARGFGGFGITYKAWDINTDTVVAIKEYFFTGVVTRDPGTQLVKIYAQRRKEEFKHFLDRFLDEARYTAKFGERNSNIVKVYEFFEANDTAYMVMEFLEGKTLNEILKKVAMDLDECVSIMEDVCSALKTIHADNVIHRDISPDNIFLCTGHKVKVIDFGAARFTRHEDEYISKLTQVLKPGFSPPEQYQTISKQGPWTDIYALGATLYYMVTGIKPVESTNRKTGEEELVSPQDIIEDLPQYINDAILRAMAVDMHLRFDTIEEFEKVIKKEKKVLNVANETKRRKKNRIIGVLTALIVVISGLSIFLYNYNEERLAETLPTSTIQLWYIVPDDEQEALMKNYAYEEIVKIFRESFSNVTIELKAYTKDEYLIAIDEAYEGNSLPSLFESDNIGDEILEETKSVNKAVQTTDEDEILFYKDFRKNYMDSKKFPLGFIASVYYEIDENIADINKDEEINEITEKELFLSKRISKYNGFTSDFYDVQTVLAGQYFVKLPDEDDRCYMFSSYMSIGECDEDQYKVVNRFLVFLLSDNAQNYLHLQHHSGSLPLNESTLMDRFVVVYDDFNAFFDNLEKFELIK